MSALDICKPKLRMLDEVDEIETVDVNQAALDEGSSFLHQGLTVVADLEQYESEIVA
jgi:hypothetical protein